MMAAFGKLSRDDIKAESCIVVCSIMNIKSQYLTHRSTKRVYIQILTHLEPRTQEITHDPDINIPTGYI